MRYDSIAQCSKALHVLPPHSTAISEIFARKNFAPYEQPFNPEVCVRGCSNCIPYLVCFDE